MKILTLKKLAIVTDHEIDYNVTSVKRSVHNQGTVVSKLLAIGKFECKN